MRKVKFPSLILVLAVLACAVPGVSAPQVQPLSTFDQNSVVTAIVWTAVAAQTQTALKLPTSTSTPQPTRTASITPTFTPTFLWGLPTLTPISTNTPSVLTVIANQGPGSPRKMSGKQWSCVVLGTYPPRHTVFRPSARFTVQWTVFNSGTSAWGVNDIDFVFKSGFRNEDTKIQDLHRPVASGGEVNLYATFVAPKAANEYQSFFNMTVGRKRFCGGFYFVFDVQE